VVCIVNQLTFAFVARSFVLWV